MPRNFNDLTGKKFERLTVLYRDADHIFKSGRKVVMWKCKCECGKECSVATTSLSSGLTKSCGCLNYEKKCDTKNKHRKFKYRNMVLYNRWRGMKKRCYVKSSTSYSSYGGRGIEVCDEWKNNFGAFQDWALKNGYKPELSLDRIDVNGNYEPSNCRWVTNSVQQNNKRNTVYLEINGEKHPISEWCHIRGFKKGVIRDRIGSGWSIEDAVLKPIRSYKTKR